MLKLFVLFGLTVIVFFFQIYSQTAQSKNDVTDLLDILKKILNESIDEAKPIIDAAATKIESTAGSVESQAETAMSMVGAEFKGQLDTIKEMAAEPGVNIDVCLTGNEDMLMNLTHEFYTYFLRNVSYKVMDGVSYLVDTMKSIKNLNNEVVDLEREMSDCDSDVSSTLCLDKLSTKIETAVIALPNEIRKLVNTAQALADQACTGIEDYVSTVIADLQSEGGTFLSTIFDCVDRMVK